jgi:hypothetical protein
MTTLMSVKRKYVTFEVHSGESVRVLCIPEDEVQDAVKAYRQKGLVVEFL